MKKTILAIAAVLTTYAGFSQDLMSKKGEAILPEAGDYALGFDAVPLFNVLKFNDGNAKIGAGYANNNGANTINGNSFGILIKRFTDAKNAYRYGANITLNNSFLKQDVASYNNGASVANSIEEDKVRSSSFATTLSMGVEKRRGNTRVQGYYGGEAFIALSGSRTTVEYGNSINDLPNSQNSSYFADNGLDAAAYGYNGSTYLDQSRSGIAFTVGARAFAGVEFFVAPKLSINAEYGFAAGLNFTPRGEQDRITVSGANTNTETFEGTRRSTTFNVGTGTTQGAIRVLFHF